MSTLIRSSGWVPGMHLARRHGRSLTLLAAATALAVTEGPLWAYQRGLLGPADPGLRVLLGLPMRLVVLARNLARGATLGAALLLMLDVRERWLNLVGRVLVESPPTTTSTRPAPPAR
jgi:hypothetical protein